MEIYFKLSWDEHISPIQDRKFVMKETNLDVTSRNEYYEKHGHYYKQKEICSQLWRTPQINWDGRVLGCCVNYWGDFGNVFEEGLEQALNNEKITYARLMLLGKKKSRSDIPCSTCSYYLQREKDNNWLQSKEIKQL